MPIVHLNATRHQPIVVWDCEPVTADAFAHQSTLAGGFFRPVSPLETAVDSDYFTVMFWGQDNQLYGINIDVGHQPTYYIGRKVYDAPR